MAGGAMTIGLNAIDFFPGRMGGIETYFRNLLRYLQAVDTNNRYAVLCIEPNAAEFPLKNPGFGFVRFRCARPSARWLVRGALRRAFGVDILAPAINRLRLDVLHHPFTTLNTPGLKCPSVLTFHDMQHEFHPAFFTGAELRKRKRTFRSSAMEATRIIATSDHVKRCLENVYRIDSRKIDVVPIGCGPEFRVIREEQDMAEVRARHGLDMPFLFYPAATWPHKNHGRLLEALKMLKDRGTFDGRLVLSGIAMTSHRQVVDDIRRLGLEDTVKVLGYTRGDDLPLLYNLAELLVFPSLFEGFGIPVVEAMACGCPVACSNRTSLPEIVGTAGVLFDPESPEDIADTIGSLWRNGDRLNRMRESGLDRVGAFRWEEVARKTMDVYAKAAKNG